MPVSRDVAVLGESMLEIKPGHLDQSNPQADAKLGYGGDTMNFCVYLSRLGRAPHFVSAVGDDRLSDWLLSQWRAEGVNCDLVRREQGAVPGLYAIHTDADGERSFMYWREQAPVRRLLDDAAQRQAVFDAMMAFPFVYLSGITLAIFSATARDHIFDFLSAFRQRGGRVVFDNNYRAGLWPGADAAAAVFERAYRHADMALPTLDDECQVFGPSTATQCVDRLRAWGCPEIVLKNGPAGSTVCDEQGVLAVAAPTVEHVVDTTSAGDSFNAGYLAARLNRRPPAEAAAFGHALAATVVQHPGAIVPPSAIDPLLQALSGT